MERNFDFEVDSAERSRSISLQMMAIAKSIHNEKKRGQTQTEFCKKRLFEEDDAMTHCESMTNHQTEEEKQNFITWLDNAIDQNMSI